MLYLSQHRKIIRPERLKAIKLFRSLENRHCFRPHRDKTDSLWLTAVSQDTAKDAATCGARSLISDSFRIIVPVVGLVLFSALARAESLPKYFRLTVLHTNDIHGHLLPFDTDTYRDFGGVSRRARLIQSMRSSEKWPVLALDAGDVFERGPIASDYHGEPDFEAMNLVQYDAMTLGNNEFKGADGAEGQKILRVRIKQARFPVVCANVVDKSTGKTLVPPYVILERHGVKIGVFGLTTPRIASYSQIAGLTILDPVATAREMVSELQDKADVIVAISHLSYPLDLVLAQEVPQIDLIVGGDSHTFVWKPFVMPTAGSTEAFRVGGPVIVQDGEFGAYLGHVDLWLRLSGKHDYQVMSVRGELIPITAETPGNPAVDKMLNPYLRRSQEVVGKLTQSVSPKQAPAWTAEILRRAIGADIVVSSTNGITIGLRTGPVTIL